MTLDELTIILQQEFKSLASKVEDDDWTNAINDALRDTGFVLPTTDNFQITWIKRRTKRHIFYYFLTQNADKFKFEQMNLQHRFEHYEKLVKTEDDAFEVVQEEESYRFAGVEAYHMFGHKIDAGFASDRLGRDLTYDQSNIVIVKPTKE